MKVMCVNNHNKNSVNCKSRVQIKARITPEIIERANEATINQRNIQHHSCSLSIFNNGELGISIKNKRRDGTITETILTEEQLRDAYGKALDKVFGRKN